MQGVFPYIQLSTPDLSNVAQDWLPIKTMVPGTEVVSLPKKNMGPVRGCRLGFQASSYDCDTFPSWENHGQKPWVNTNPMHHTLGEWCHPLIHLYIFILFLPKKALLPSPMISALPLLQSLYFLYQDSNKSFKIRWVLGPSPRDAVPNQVNHVRTQWRWDWCLGLLRISQWEPTVHSGCILWITYVDT